MTAIFLCPFAINSFVVPLWIFCIYKAMKTLFEQITHWKEIGEWENIKRWYVQTDTHERYYEIVLFVNEHRAEYGYRYREKILNDARFIARFGYLDQDYLKYAISVMRKKKI